MARIKALINVGGIPFWMTFDSEKEARDCFGNDVLKVEAED